MKAGQHTVQMVCTAVAGYAGRLLREAGFDGRNVWRCHGGCVYMKAVCMAPWFGIVCCRVSANLAQAVPCAAPGAAGVLNAAIA
jgi:hypothetical protein